jgi:hypothetical protein
MISPYQSNRAVGNLSFRFHLVELDGSEVWPRRLVWHSRPSFLGEEDGEWRRLLKPMYLVLNEFTELLSQHEFTFFLCFWLLVTRKRTFALLSFWFTKVIFKMFVTCTHTKLDCSEHGLAEYLIGVVQFLKLLSGETKFETVQKKKETEKDFDCLM